MEEDRQVSELTTGAERIESALLALVSAYCDSEDLERDMREAIGLGGYDLENCIMWVLRMMPRPDCAGACFGRFTNRHARGCYRAVWDAAQIKDADA